MPHPPHQVLNTVLRFGFLVTRKTLSVVAGADGDSQQPFGSVSARKALGQTQQSLTSTHHK